MVELEIKRLLWYRDAEYVLVYLCEYLLKGLGLTSIKNGASLTALYHISMRLLNAGDYINPLKHNSAKTTYLPKKQFSLQMMSSGTA